MTERDAAAATLYLASRSPRRRELLAQIGAAFQVLDVAVDEERLAGEPPQAYVLRVAADKARACAATLPAAARVLAADTAVVLEGTPLGKPANAEHARHMLERLSGRTHQVLTGVALSYDGRCEQAISESRVTMRTISAAERAAYVATGEPLDKAGAYAIQGLAAVFIRHLEGSYSGVMGLPLFETASLLAASGLRLPPETCCR